MRDSKAPNRLESLRITPDMSLPRRLQVLKIIYVGMIRCAEKVADATGVRSILIRHPKSRVAHWIQSLFAIYDIDELIRLDVPWWTYAAIEEVETFLAARPGARVFEYGSGASTVWIARRGHIVTSIEHDEDWFSTVKSKLKAYPNAVVVLKKPDDPTNPKSVYRSLKAGHAGESFTDYVLSIDAYEGDFDLVIIDGRSRAGCLAQAVGKLKKDGLIIFDNSGRNRYREAIIRSGLRNRRFKGLAPALPYPDETSLLDFENVVP